MSEMSQAEIQEMQQMFLDQQGLADTEGYDWNVYAQRKPNSEYVFTDRMAHPQYSQFGKAEHYVMSQNCDFVPVIIVNGKQDMYRHPRAWCDG